VVDDFAESSTSSSLLNFMGRCCGVWYEYVLHFAPRSPIPVLYVRSTSRLATNQQSEKDERLPRHRWFLQKGELNGAQKIAREARASSAVRRGHTTKQNTKQTSRIQKNPESMPYYAIDHRHNNSIRTSSVRVTVCIFF
jgi:hypothetical protein